MCQDETRLGLKTLAGRVITAPGVKPVGLSQWQRDNFYLYGVVEPLTGYSFFYEFSHLDGDCFQKFLELLSAEGSPNNKMPSRRFRLRGESA